MSFEGKKGRPAILLDRDGTIIVERNYLADPALVELEANAAHGLRRLADEGWPLVVLTNQSGVGRGLFDHAAVDAVNARAADLLAAEGVAIAGWYVCPHRPDEGCACRKPGPLLALQAAADLGLDLSRSWIVGDKLSDAAMAPGIGARGALMLSRHASPSDARDAESRGMMVAYDLADFAQRLITTS